MWGRFLTFIDLYLKSTAAEFEDKTYTQKEGVCIGSSTAPVLSEIYLNQLDLKIRRMLQSMPEGSVLITIYVDDILVISKEKGLLPSIKDVITYAAPELCLPAKNRTRVGCST